MNYNQILALLVIAVILGAILGYYFRDRRMLWAIADWAWICAVIVTAYFSILGLESLSAAADRTSAVKLLADKKDLVRLAAYRLDGTYCSTSVVTKNASATELNRLRFCKVVQNVLKESALIKFPELIATQLATEVSGFQGKYFPDGSFDLHGALSSYASFYSRWKSELEANPYEDVVQASRRITNWLYGLVFLLIFRSGRTYAEIFNMLFGSKTSPSKTHGDSVNAPGR